MESMWYNSIELRTKAEEEKEEEMMANKICNIEKHCTKTVNENHKPLKKIHSTLQKNEKCTPK